MSTKVGKISHQDNPLEFPARLEHLYEMLTYIKQAAKDIGFGNTLVSKIELAGEEALVNIISHGYPKNPGTIHIHCKQVEEKLLSIVIQDDGIPFNPLEAIKNFSPAEDLDNQEPVENTQVGGYGIYFIINMMDHVDYEFSDGKNMLILKKSLPD